MSLLVLLSLLLPPCHASLTDPAGTPLFPSHSSHSLALHGSLLLVEEHSWFPWHGAAGGEARFRRVFPPGATLSRLAMNNTGTLIEGEIIERSKAHSVYRELLHRGVDPALAEQVGGNEVSVKVFPLMPDTVVHFVVSYSLVVPARAGQRRIELDIGALNVSKSAQVFVYALPQGTEHLSIVETPFGDKDVTAEFDVNHTYTAQGTKAQLEAGTGILVIEATLPDASAGAPLTLLRAPAPTDSAGTVEMSMGSVIIPGEVLPASWDPASSDGTLPEAWKVFLDTSASVGDTQVLRVPMTVELLSQVLDTAPPNSTLEVFACDVEVVSLLPASDTLNAAALTLALQERMALGMTNLSAVVSAAGAAATAHSAQDEGSSIDEVRVLIVSDGIATLGTADTAAELGAQVAEELSASVPVYTISIGTRLDAAVLSTLSAGRGRLVQMPVRVSEAEVQQAVEQAVATVRQPIGSTLEVEVAGAAWIQPPIFHDVHPGDELVFFVAMDAAPVPVPKLSRYNPASGNLDTLQGLDEVLVDKEAERVSAIELLVAREAHHAILQRLMTELDVAEDPIEAAELQGEVVRESETFRILTPYTALLVLDSEEQYRQFGIDRNALANILIVTEQGVAVLDRTLPSFAPATPAPSQEDANVEDGEDESGNGESSFGDFNDPGTVDGREALGAFDSGSAARAGSRSTGLAVLLVATLLLLLAPMPVGAVTEFRDPVPDPAEVQRSQEEAEEHPFTREYTSSWTTNLLLTTEPEQLRAVAAEWVTWDSRNPEPYEKLGWAASQLDEHSVALRAYLSMAEVSPRDSAMLARSAVQLLSIGEYDWAILLMHRAIAERPKHPNFPRFLALAHWMKGNHTEAVAVLDDAMSIEYDVRYGKPAHEMAALKDAIQGDEGMQAGVFTWEPEYRFRATLSWETDANDVDLHAIAHGEECYFGDAGPLTKSGLHLISGDQTRGLGPEAIVTDKEGTVAVGVNLFSAGAFTVARGVLVVLQFEEGMKRLQPQLFPFVLKASGNGVYHLGDF